MVRPRPHRLRINNLHSTQPQRERSHHLNRAHHGHQTDTTRNRRRPLHETSRSPWNHHPVGPGPNPVLGHATIHRQPTQVPYSHPKHPRVGLPSTARTLRNCNNTTNLPDIPPRHLHRKTGKPPTNTLNQRHDASTRRLSHRLRT